ncbi:hypothetical protein ABFS83_06G111000 [Erythranthe nasuta]
MTRVSWDEIKLAEIEANKPVRQKITEPKTPYHPMIDADDDDAPSTIVKGSFEDCFDDTMQAEAADSGSNVGSSSKTDVHHSGWTSSEEDGDAMDEDEEGSDSERRKSFRDHRTAHYDEYHKVLLHRNGSSLEEESDEETKSNGKKVAKSGVKEMEDVKESSQPANGS